MDWKKIIGSRVFAVLTFSILTILIFANIGIFRHIHDRPNSTHTWAQCDRACVAAGYYYEDMNFFLPRVYNRSDRSDQGICGMEFPFVNYVAAICYKVFGFDETYYRLTTFTILLAGLVFSFLLAYRVLNDYFFSALLVWLFMLSPVLVFYSANFLPDTASLGFIMMGWYLFFRLGDPDRRSLIKLLFFVCISLACLIKLTSAVNVIVMILLLLVQKIFFRKNEAIPQLKPDLMIGFLICIVCIAAWYVYADFLSRTNQNFFFIMKGNTVKTRLQLYDSLYITYYNMYKFYYPALTKKIIFIAALIFSCTFFYHRGYLAFLFFFCLIGFLCVVLLLLRQYELHDYYIITILPVIYFLLLSTAEFIKRKMPGNRIIYGAALASLVLIVNMSMVVCKKSYQEDRYGSGYRRIEYSQFDSYTRLEPYLDSIGVKKDDLVISYIDFTPNVSLYLMNRKGVTANPWNSGWLKDPQFKSDFRYFILNDTTWQTKWEFRHLCREKIGQKDGVHIYKLQ